MNSPSFRKPGSPNPIPLPSPKESPVGFFGLVGAVLVGAFVSGIAIVIGAALAGPIGEFYPLIYFIGAAIFSIPLSIVVIGSWRAASGHNRSEFLAVPFIFIPMAALVVGLLIPSIRRHEDQLSLEKQREANQRYVQYYEILRADPEIALRERWFEGDKERKDTFKKSLTDPNFDYPPSLRERLRREVPYLDQKIGVSDDTPQTTDRPLRFPVPR